MRSGIPCSDLTKIVFVCVDIANISIRGKCLFETPFHLKFCEILHSRQHYEGFMAHDFVTDVSIKVYRSSGRHLFICIGKQKMNRLIEFTFLDFLLQNLNINGHDMT